MISQKKGMLTPLFMKNVAIHLRFVRCHPAKSTPLSRMYKKSNILSVVFVSLDLNMIYKPK